MFRRCCSGMMGFRPFLRWMVESRATMTTRRALGPPVFLEASRKRRWPGWRRSKAPVARTVLGKVPAWAAKGGDG